MPLTPRPFDLWGRQVGLSYEDLLERAYDLRDRKIMRRFSAVLYHRKAGFRANAMGVWRVPDERIDEVGDAGFVRDDLLRSQSNARRRFGRQRKRFVHRVRVQRLRSA